ncbi:S1 RNA-binding domain-containing protein [Clostridium sporogenes]|uniref:S1 RNA-binding domain-containing protein n=1 Tax=Clostridium botulinum TaxID=1491 RepID=A0A6M0T777_CLOBO|nr:S1-like domain-containing RNA-binding protein [Clostridium sporogenes]NFA61971.1 S1 RNA-binding domain-containing protein [Clostridium botulinum]NFI75025.1 S1 RNA-binding domain-containing protein [Clostridium sporogenes]NFM25949.1 S1 RNA-binding domain-containing protein [Clostridium sporogenes]NFP63151.1 S1 RNA-binding domain-containing protein [Clostridium sporogenes]NFU94003.1 S1 RNA-binding domain-containing protein [Clostridium sporogenes]
MIKLGEIQKLEIIREAPMGVYLNSKEDKSENDILLPGKQVPKDAKIGDEVEVFVYRDSEDRMIATINRPKITIGEIAPLKVIEKTKMGAFLDWGLERDLFLPFKEQTYGIQEGKEYLVYLYIDKSDRLCASMNVYRVLGTESHYKENDQVKGFIYDIKKEIGAFVAVDNEYHGLIPKNEIYDKLRYGDIVEARVTKVKEDGKLDLSIRKKAYKQMDEDADIILEKLNYNGGKLYLNDNSDPRAIKELLNMSKNAFKRAVGRLLKEGKIEFIEKGIKLK